MFYFLSHHPDAYDKLQREIDTFISTNDTVTLASLNSLKYLECCIKETVRLIPATPLIGRTTSGPIQVTDKLTIPANIDVLVFIRYILTRPEHFREPERFYPDRWLLGLEPTENGQPWCTEEAFVAFSTGPRSCPGREFAILNLKKFMINLMGQYDFKVLNKYGDIRPINGFIESAAEYPIQFSKRS